MSCKFIKFQFGLILFSNTLSGFIKPWVKSDFDGSEEVIGENMLEKFIDDNIYKRIIDRWQQLM